MQNYRRFSILGLLAVVSVLLSFTSFYSIAYLIAIIAVGTQFNGLNIFKSSLQRIILQLLIFLATTPLVGLVSWMAGIKDYPVLNLIGYSILATLLYFPVRKTRNSGSPTIDKVDIVAILIAIVPVIVIGFSFLANANKTASLFQLTSEGWDNGSHILMMQADSAERGYVYGPFDEVKSKIIQRFNAYPQAWHLTSADFVNGFGGNRFVPSQPKQTMLAYMAVSIGWMMLASYILLLCSWRLYEHVKKKKLTSLVEASPIIVASLLITVVVFVASLMHGFTNYIGSIVYILLLIAMMVEAQKVTDDRPYKIAVLAGTMSVLTWFLILPAIGLAILMMLLSREKSLAESLRLLMRHRSLLILSVICIIFMIIQVYVFQAFSSVSGDNQLNAGAVVDPFLATRGPMPLSQLFSGIIVFAGLIFAYKSTTAGKSRTLYLAIVLPWIILSIGVFVYQNATVGYNSYYLPKILGLSLVASSLVAMIPFTEWINRHVSGNYRWLSVPLTSIILVSLLVITTGQSAFGISKLFQNNTRTSYKVAVAITSEFPKAVSDKYYIVTLTNRVNYEGAYEGNHGKLEIRLFHHPLNCTYEITSAASLNEKIDRLSACADTLKESDKKIIVITSKETHKLVESLHKDNIIVKNT